MRKEEKIGNKPAQKYAESYSFWSLLTVSWLNPLLKLARKHSLGPENVPPVLESYSAKELSKLLGPFWRQMQEYHLNSATVKKPRLRDALRVILWKELTLCSCASVFDGICVAALPIVLQQYISLLEAGSASYILAFTIWAISLCSYICFFIYVFVMYCRVTNSVSIILQNAILKKALVLSPTSKAKYSKADILNLIQTEVPVAQHSFDYFVGLGEVIKIIAKLVLLWFLLGIISLVAVSVLLTLAFAGFYLSKTLEVDITAWRSATNNRISILREFIQGSTVVKLLGLESQFECDIRKHDKEQLKHLSKFFVKRSAIFAIEMGITVLTAVITFSVFTATGGKLSPSIVFPCLLLFNISSPLNILNQLIGEVSQAQTPLNEIEAFLLAEEMVLDAEEKNDDRLIKLKGCRWRHAVLASVNENVVEGFSLNVEELSICDPGFYSITGIVGSGKSTFLKALLGIVHRETGDFNIQGRLAYCAQEPWIMQTSIEENIVFGSEFNSERLSLVVECCGLQQDLLTFPNGIKTEIGENGVNLSGGQKSRIALARAVYSDADIVLLDCPLASCDAKVSQRIFARLRQVLKEKIVLLVTSSEIYLSRSDCILEFDQGRLNQTLIARDGHFYSVKTGVESSQYTCSILDEQHTVTADDSEIKVHVLAVTAEDADKDNAFIQEEEKADKINLYKEALTKAGPFSFPLLMFTVLLSITTSAASPLWLAKWIFDIESSTSNTFMIVFVLLGLSDSISTGLQILLYCFKGQRIGSTYQEEAMKGLLTASQSFYDTNPIGRILNRMNADVSRVEKIAPGSFAFLFMYLSSLLSSSIVICISSPWLIIMFLVFEVITSRLIPVYQNGYLEINRLLPLSLSAVATHVDQTLEGIDTISAFHQEDCFVEMCNPLFDQYSSIFIATENVMFWLESKVMVMITSISLAIAVIGCVGTPSSVLASLVGVGLTSASSLQQSLAYFVINLTNMEANMNAIERLRHYAHDLPYEKVDGSLKLDQKWPLKGDIELDQVQVSYDQRPDHLVIKDLTLSIRSGEKIGICGRTGCGKSTLVSSLFRLIELKSGMIKIDGVDISQLDLKTLRRGLQIIPQAQFSLLDL